MVRRVLNNLGVPFSALGLLLICLSGCDEDNKNPKVPPVIPPKPKIQNVILLLDLSNRLTLEEQVKRDSSLIVASLMAFEKNQIKYRFQISKDRLSLAIAYQNSSQRSNFAISDDILIDMAMRNPRMNKPVFNDKKTAFLAAVDSIYSQTLKTNTSGADVWSYFCNDLSNNLVKGAKNKIIIFTDGYLQFDRSIQTARPKGTYMTNMEILRNKSDWESIFDSKNMKLNPCPNKFEHDIEVLMLEIAPKAPHVNTNEFKIIEKYWKTWFQEMGINCRGIYQSSYYQTISEQKLETEISSFLKE